VRRLLPAGREEAVAARILDLRIDRELFSEVLGHVEDFTRGEEAGYLICRTSRLEDRDVLLAREWLPVPDEEISRNSKGSVLAWSASFNSDALEHALEDGGTMVLVHSHGSARPAFSPDDRDKERRLFAGLSLLAGEVPIGTLLLGRGDAVGSFWKDGRPGGHRFGEVTILGGQIKRWQAVGAPSRAEPVVRRRLDRQSLAVGPHADATLRRARVAVIGASGGGSHVVQQLAHMGIGTLIPIDDQLVEETNLGRLVGAHAADVERTRKVEVARRLARGIDPEIEVEMMAARFPEMSVIEALKGVDVVVACVDRFDVREGINAFCRRYLIPQIDIGIELRSSGERLVSADGQMIVSLPGRPCLRCWFLTDALLAAERRRRPPGYDANPDAPGEPQVVSMNAVLAGEACNSVLDLLTGYSGGARGAAFWQYDGRAGELTQHELPSRRGDCPACAEEGLGDPSRG
jgi:molybdopterin/thiamine biosynthesis adenylyltransferase